MCGTRAQPIGDGCQLPLGVARQVGASRQVLTEQAIGVFIGASLPGAMGIGKEDADHEMLTQPFVGGHLFAPVKCPFTDYPAGRETDAAKGDLHDDSGIGTTGILSARHRETGRCAFPDRPMGARLWGERQPGDQSTGAVDWIPTGPTLTGCQRRTCGTPL